MKNICVVLLFAPVVLYSQAKNATELYEAGLKKYENQSGKISYTISGDAEGEEVLVFDLNGWRSMRKQDMVLELYGVKNPQTLHEIIDGDFSYRLYEKDSTFVSRKDNKWSQQAAYKTPAQSSEAILFSLGGNKVADSTIINKVCEVWSFEGKALQQLWIWKGLVLKRKTKLGDRIIYSEANNIELGLSPDPTLFDIPSYLKEKE